MTETAKVGHNRPPSLIEDATVLGEETNNWLTEHPVITSEEEAREGKLLVDRLSNTSKDMEVELRAHVEPLTRKIGEISQNYVEPRNRLKWAYQTLLERIADYLKKEKVRREEVAATAIKKAGEAENVARQAEAKEWEARVDASTGVVVDVGRATTEADATFQTYQAASREAARAVKDAHVKVGGGFRRALGLRKKEVLEVEDAVKAVYDMSNAGKLPESLIKAIITAARIYRKVSGQLPIGIKSTTTEGL